jgi:hypothetical protein
MPIIKNRLFQPIGVMLSDGTMLHLQSREERDVSPADLDAPHLKGLIASGQLALQERDRPESAAPPPREPILEPKHPAPSESEPAEGPESRRHKGRKSFLGLRREDETE